MATTSSTSHAPVGALDGTETERRLDGVLQKTGRVKVMFNAIDLGNIQGQALAEMWLE